MEWREAAMALSDEIREQRQKLKGQGAKAYLSYFWEYYRWPTVAVIAVAAMAISIVHSIATNKPNAINAIFLNAANPELTRDSEWIDAPFAEYAGIDTEEYGLTIDTSSYITPGGAASQMEMGTTEKIMAYAAAQDLDVMTADPYNFQNYARNGMFVDLRTVLSAEQLEKYEPYFYYAESVVASGEDDLSASEAASAEAEAAYVRQDAQEIIAQEQKDVYVAPDPETMQNPVPIGVIMTDAPYLSSVNLYGNSVAVTGIIYSSPRQETALQFLDYLWEH